MYRLQCFGGAVVKAPDGDEVHFRSRKHLALLLYLAANPRRAPSREELARLLWDTDESAARHSLSQALYDIRRRLRPFDLQARGGSLRLGDGQLRYEGSELEEAVKTAKLSRVSGLYRGEFAPNLDQLGADRFDRWLESERTRYATLAQMALRRYAEECDLQGRWGEMCLTALRLVKLDPLDEAAHRALMRALWLHGDQQSALRHYSEVEEFLVRELPEGISHETRELVQRIRSSRPPPRGTGTAAPTEVPLVGREEEFERLRTAVRDVRHGSGGVVVVRGPAGIGKTRLLQELAKVTPVEGVTRLGSRCYSAESDVAYGPVADGVRRVAEELAQEDTDGSENGTRYFQLGHLFPDLFELSPDQDYQGVDPDVRKRRLYEEVADLLRRAVASAPIVWIVEDVQWIDASSASLLHYVTRRLRDRPFLLMLSLRTDESVADAARGLIQVSADSSQPTFIDLPPLPPSSIRELVQRAGEGVNRRAVELAEKYSGGNPFYALEILRSAEAVDQVDGEGLPPGCLSERLKGLLGARVRVLGSEPLRFMEAVAVLDRHATVQAVAAIAGFPGRAAIRIASSLCDRAILVLEAGALRFTHDLMREFVYSRLGSLRRSALHLAAGEILAKEGTIGSATLARHFELGDDSPRTYEYSLRAADEARSACAYREAITMAEIAQGAAASSDQRAYALRVRALTHLQSGQFESAADTLREVIALRSYEPEIEIPLTLSLVRAYIETCDWSQALQTAEKARPTLDKIECSRTRTERQIELLAYMAKLGLRSGDSAVAKTAIGELQRVSEAARKSGTLTSDALLETIASRAVYLSFTGSTKQAFHLLSKAPSTRQESHRYVRLLLNHSLVALRLAKWDQAEALANSGMQLARRHNDLLYAADCQNNLACVRYEQGRWSEALDDCRSALKIYDALGTGEQIRLTALINIANIYFYTGVPTKARQLYKNVLASAIRLGDLTLRDEIIASLGLLDLMRGAYDEAARRWAELEREAERPFATQDWYKQTWFRSVVASAFLSENLSSEVRALAGQVARSDLLESLKLRWLASLLAYHERSEPEDPISEQLLRQHRLGWFAAFSRRWFKVVMESGLSGAPKSTASLFEQGRRGRGATRLLRSAQRQVDTSSLPAAVT